MNEQASELVGQGQARYTPQNLNEAVNLRNGIALIPYGEANGTRTVPDDLIVSLYHELDADGVIEAVFRDDMQDAKAFVKSMKHPENLPVFVLVDGDILGVAWLNGIKKNCAFSHFVFVKRCLGKHSIEMGRRLLGYWFALPSGDGFIFDVLIGNIPARNRLAINYIKKLGYKELGKIPYLADGEPMSVSYIERIDHG